MSVSELKHKISGDVFCFGAGQAFDNFVYEFSLFQLENNIKAIVDNRVNMRKNFEKNVNSVSIPVISLEEMLCDITDEDCILITTSAYEEVVGQLEKIEKLKNVTYCIYLFLRIEQYDYNSRQIQIPSCLSVYEEIRIPKTIHYCWLGKKEIPPQYREWMDSWKKYCPDYEIIEWNEGNYDVHKSKYVSQAYESKKWAFVSDYARIDIINTYGGVYLDTDVELTKNLDVLLKNDAFCGFETSQYVAYGLGFGAVKGHPILGELKEYYDHTDFMREDGAMDLTACPVIQTRIMKEHGLVCNGEFQVVDGMTVYPSRVLCGMSPHSFRVEIDPDYTYAVHHYTSSWIEEEQDKAKQKLLAQLQKWGKQ